MGADIPNQIGQLSFHYWYLAAISILFILALYIFFRDGRPSQPASSDRVKTADWFREVVILIVVVTLAVMGGRGGWQRRRLTTALAAVGDRESLSQLALNSTYTLINSQTKCDIGSIGKFRYFATDEELKRQFPSNRLTGGAGEERLDNVVIIIVESLSSEYTGIGNPNHGYTPFLDSLAQRGIYFKNSFADGRRSIDAPHEQSG